MGTAFDPADARLSLLEHVVPPRPDQLYCVDGWMPGVGRWDVGENPRMSRTILIGGFVTILLTIPEWHGDESMLARTFRTILVFSFYAMLYAGLWRQRPL